MQTKHGFFRRHLRTLGTLLFVSLYTVTLSYATPPTTPYTPGATLDPSCIPGNTNCSVQILPDQSTNTGKYLTTDGSTTSWSLIGNASLQHASISINGSAISLGGSITNLALTTSSLSQFASTTSTELATTISDETGTGALVFGTSPTFTTSLTTPAILSSGALALTPAAGSNLTITLATTGDLAVNTNQLYVDTSTGRVGIGTSTPQSKFSVNGDIRISAGSGGQIIFADGSTMSSSGLGSAAALSAANDAIITGDSDSDTNGDVIIKTGSTERLHIANNGTITVPLFGSGVVTSNVSGVVTSTTTLSGLSSVTATSFTGALTGNASTATALQTPHTIAGVSFDGTTNIAIPASGLSNGVTGSGTIVLSTSPTLTTPNIGAATGTSLNLSSGTITSGLINGQTISSAANFTGSLSTAGLITGTAGLIITNPNGGYTANIIADNAGRGFTVQNADFNGTSIGTALRINMGGGSGNTTPSISSFNNGTSGAGNLNINALITTFGGSIAASAISGTTGSFSGLLTTNTTGENIKFNSLTTSAGYLHWSSSGDDMYLGNESSVGGTIFAGSSAYATVLGNKDNKNIEFFSGSKVLTLTSSGSLTATGGINGTAGTYSGLLTAQAGLFTQSATSANDTLVGMTLERTGGAAAGADQRGIGMVFKDQSNTTLTGGIAGYRSLAGSNYNGYLKFYVNSGALPASSFSDLSLALTLNSDSSATFSNTVNAQVFSVNRNDGGYSFASTNGINSDLLIGVTASSSGTQYAYLEGSGTTNIVLNPTAGNVGIGTTSPSTLLQIQYPSYIDKDTIQGVLRLTGQSNTENGTSVPSAGTALEFYNKWAGGSEYSVGRISGRASLGYHGGLQFDVAQNTGPGQSNFTTAMTILDNSNVGIGTTSPGYKLDVLGTANASYLRADGGRIVANDAANNDANAGVNLHSLTIGRNSTASTGWIQSFGTGAETLQLNPLGGNVYVGALGTGTVYSNSGNLTNTNPSDERLKNTINPLQYGLAQILQLQPKTYYYNDDINHQRLQYGFIAQDVQSIMPELVRPLNDGTDHLGLEINGIFVTTVKAIQEMDIQVQAIPVFTDTTLYAKVADFLREVVGQGRVRAQREVCIGDESDEVCVTKDQLRALLSGQSNTSIQSGGGDTPPVDPTPAHDEGDQVPDTPEQSVVSPEETTPTDTQPDTQVDTSTDTSTPEDTGTTQPSDPAPDTGTENTTDSGGTTTP